MEIKDHQIIVNTAMLAMLGPTFVEVKVDMLQFLCSPCLESLASHRDLLSLATWKGQSIANILASQDRKMEELAQTNEEQNRKNEELDRKNEELDRKIEELDRKNEELDRKLEELDRKNEEQNRSMAILQQQAQLLVESDRRRTSAIKTAKRQISYHINDFVVANRLFEDGQSLMEVVKATEHHGTVPLSAAMK